MAVGGLGAGSQMSGFGGGRRSGMAILAALPGLGLGFIGFIGLVLSQMGRAGVDSAEYGQQMLKIARDQLAVSERAIKQSQAAAENFAALKIVTPDATPATGFENRITGAEELGLGSDADARPLDESEAVESPAPQVAIEHRGRQIDIVDGEYRIGTMRFKELEYAKAYIDKLGYSAQPSPTTVRIPTLSGVRRD